MGFTRTLTWPTKKKKAIRDYLAIFLRSDITKCIKYTMVIDRIVTCIFYDRGRISQSQQDHDDHSRVFSDEMKWDYNFF